MGPDEIAQGDALENKARKGAALKGLNGEIGQPWGSKGRALSPKAPLERDRLGEPALSMRPGWQHRRSQPCPGIRV